MKFLTLILAIFLSLYSEDKSCVVSSCGELAVEQEQSQDDSCLNRDICLNLTQGNSFSGNGGSGSFLSVKAHKLPRKATPCIKDSFVSLPSYWQTDSSRTYLFSICKLRI